MILHSFNQSHIENSSTPYYFVDITVPWSFRQNSSSDNVTESTDCLHQLQIDRYRRDPLYIAIPLTFLYSFLLITGIIGNLITCVVILKNKDLHTATNYYLFSLAVSDLLFLIFGLPLEIFYIWQRYPYIFGETFCLMRGLMAETSTNASVLTITAFTIERYMAICYPFFSHTLSNLSRVIKLILGIWIISVICAIPQVMQFGVVSTQGPEFRQCTMVRTILPYSFELSTLIFFVIPMIIITILYIRIGVKLKSSAKLKGRRIPKPMLCLEYQQNSSQKLLGTGQPSRKILKMLVAVVITFFVCWAPFHVQRLIAIRSVEHPNDPTGFSMTEIYDVTTYISAILFYLSATVNPILYHTMSHKFRDAFKDTAREIICCTNGNNNYKFKRSRSSQMYHSVNKARQPSVGAFGVDYSPNNQTRIVDKEIVAETETTTNYDTNVDLTQFDLNVGVLSCANNVHEKITSFTDSATDRKEIEEKKVFVWFNHNNNIDMTTGDTQPNN